MMHLIEMASTSEDRITKRRKYNASDMKRRFCPHCQEMLSFKTYKFHKRLYYDKVEYTWLN